MKLSEITLLEAPLNIEPIDYFKLNDPDINLEEYKKRISAKYSKKKLIMKLTETASIYQYKSEFFCLDTAQQLISYYMSYEVARNRILGDYVWQSLVWTDLKIDISYLHGISAKVFWENLFKKYHTIVTDSEQTWHGKRFWELRISEALRENLNVYYYDFSNNFIERLENINNLLKFQEKYQIWGDQPPNLKRRMVITDKTF